MAANWQDIQQKFDALPVRLRVLVFIAVVMIFILLIDLIWLTPGLNAIKKSKQQLAEQNNQVAKITAQLQQRNAEIYAAQHSSEQQELKRIDRQIDQLKTTLEASTLNLINPQEMVGLLKSIIAGFDQLRLVKLEKLPAEAINAAAKGHSANNNEASVQIYRHTLRMNFVGNYQTTIKFLKVLEQLPRKMQFDRFDYSVERYPNADVTIDVSTLSFNKEWIGG